MKTSTRNLIVVAVCIVALGGVAAALLLTGNKEGDTSSTASTGTIELVSKKSEDIVSMQVTNKKGSYTLLPSVAAASSASSAGDNITYHIKELSGVPINAEVAGQVVQNGFSLIATKNLGTFEDLNKFGLKTPQATVEVSFKDGSTYNYKIGNSSATDSSVYYMCGEKSANVYVVNIDGGILEDKNYFVSKDILSIANSSGVNDFTKIALSGTNFPQPITLKKQGTVMVLTAPINAETDADNLSAIETALSELTADSVEAVNPDASILKNCGLDKPAAVSEFTVNKGDYKLLVGAKRGDSYYVILDKVSAVYLVKADSIRALAETNIFALRSKSLLMPNISTVKSVSVSVGDTTDTLIVERTKDETKSTEDKVAYTYKVTGTNAAAIDYSTSYTAFFKSIIGIQLLEGTDVMPGGKPDLNVEFQYFDKDNKDTIAFYKSGVRRYTAVVDGSVCGVVTAADTEKIINNIKLLESGKTVS